LAASARASFISAATANCGIGTFFNQPMRTDGSHYQNPLIPSSPLEQGFALEVTVGDKKEVRPLNHSGFAEISFCGEYPIANIEYHDPQVPVSVALEAFSPFVPLNTEDSSLPATVLRYTVKNTSRAKVDVRLAGWLENAACLFSAPGDAAERRNRVKRGQGMLLIHSDIDTDSAGKFARPDITFEEFQKETYEGWTVTGDAFGKGPIFKTEIPGCYGDVDSLGPRVVNSQAAAPGERTAKDGCTGTLTSKEFKIARKFINFWIGGGKHPGETCLNLLVDGKVVRTATGPNTNRMLRACLDVSDLQGRAATRRSSRARRAGYRFLAAGGTPSRSRS
jgi:hypothetical protein